MVRLFFYVESVLRLIPEAFPAATKKSATRDLLDIAVRFAPAELLRRGVAVEIDGAKWLAPADVAALPLAAPHAAVLRAAAAPRVLGFHRVFVIASFLSPVFELNARKAPVEDCCVFRRTGVDGAVQKSFHCRTCFPENERIARCSACARTCHAGHSVRPAVNRHCACSCGAGAAPHPCGHFAFGTEKCCTFLASGIRYVCQKWYFCRTCFGEKNDIGDCEVCAKICHEGHNVMLAAHSAFFRDCWAGRGKYQCMCVPFGSGKCAALKNDKCLCGRIHARHAREHPPAARLAQVSATQGTECSREWR
jgi:hypothetical protein